MKYLLLKFSDENYRIVNDDANYSAGDIELMKPDLGGPRYLVSAYNLRLEKIDEIAIVRSIDEAIPALAAYYENNPPLWEPEDEDQKYQRNADAPARCGPRYIKETQFAPLWVDQIKPGQWSAYRNRCELLFDGKIAVFATCEEAQRVADAHERDGYPNSDRVNDGYSWIFSEDVDWRQDPDIVANRARLKV